MRLCHEWRELKNSLNKWDSHRQFFFKSGIDRADNIYSHALYCRNIFFLFQIYASENFFSLFPFEIRPWDAAFLWGAKHSRSTLHMDPYNWTAISSVLSGVKKWKVGIEFTTDTIMKTFMHCDICIFMFYDLLSITWYSSRWSLFLLHLN